jgi:hypothetical protein
MKIVKKIIAMFLVASMMVSMVGMSTVSVGANTQEAVTVGPFVFTFTENGDRLQFRSGNTDIPRPFEIKLEGAGNNNSFKVTTDGIVIPNSGWNPLIPGTTRTLAFNALNGDFTFDYALDSFTPTLPANSLFYTFFTDGAGTLTLNGNIRVITPNDEQVYPVNNVILTSPSQGCDDCGVCGVCDPPPIYHNCEACGVKFINQGECHCIPTSNRIPIGRFWFGFNGAGTKLIIANGSSPITEEFSLSLDGVTNDDDFLATTSGDIRLISPYYNYLLSGHGIGMYLENKTLLFAAQGDKGVKANEAIIVFNVVDTGKVTLKGSIRLDIGNNPSVSTPVNITLSNVKFKLGHVTNGDKVSITDALEVLKHLAGISTLSGDSLEAALITQSSRQNRKVSIGDVLEILKHLAGIKPNLIDNPIGGV